MIRAIATGLLGLWLLALSGTVSAQSADSYPLAESAGVIQELNLEAQTVVIDGLRYQVAMDAHVEIGGSYGAFSMLATGMRVHFEFLRISAAERRIVRLRELPPEVELQEV